MKKLILSGLLIMAAATAAMANDDVRLYRCAGQDTAGEWYYEKVFATSDAEAKKKATDRLCNGEARVVSFDHCIQCDEKTTKEELSTSKTNYKDLEYDP